MGRVWKLIPSGEWENCSSSCRPLSYLLPGFSLEGWGRVRNRRWWGEWLTLLLPMSREWHIDMHFLFKSFFFFFLDVLCFPETSHLVQHTCLLKLFFKTIWPTHYPVQYIFPLKINWEPFEPFASIPSSRELDHMFSWLELAILEFSFATDEQLLTSLEVQERSRHLQEAEGQGGNMVRIDVQMSRVLLWVLSIRPRLAASQGSAIYRHALQERGTTFVGCSFAANVTKLQGIPVGVPVLIRQCFHRLHGESTLWGCCNGLRNGTAVVKQRLCPIRLKAKGFWFLK